MIFCVLCLETLNGCYVDSCFRRYEVETFSRKQKVFHGSVAFHTPFSIFAFDGRERDASRGANENFEVAYTTEFRPACRTELSRKLAALVTYLHNYFARAL